MSTSQIKYLKKSYIEKFIIGINNHTFVPCLLIRFFVGYLDN